MKFDEPCAGDGSLVRHLQAYGFECAAQTDIEPQRPWIGKSDVFGIKHTPADVFVTNPPWRRDILHPLIVHLSDIKPTWLLFDSDWKETIQAEPYMDRLCKVVAAGRFKWIPHSEHTGKDNASWYLFDRPKDLTAEFIGRRKNLPRPANLAAALL